MVPSGIQSLFVFQISFHQVCHLIVSKWLLKLQHHIQVLGRKNKAGREKRNVQTEAPSLKELSGMPHPVNFLYLIDLSCITWLPVCERRYVHYYHEQNLGSIKRKKQRLDIG